MAKIRALIRILVCLFIPLLFAGCSFPTELFFEPPPVDNTARTNQPPTPTFTVLPTTSPIPPTSVPCAYAYANNPLPDETAMVQDALKKAGLNSVEITVMAYGENCVDTIKNQVIRFSVMQTDFYFTIPVKDATSAAEMGTWAAKVLPVLKDFPPGKVPGPNLGYVQLNYQDGKDSKTLWVKIDLAQRALGNGLSGEPLFNALNYSQP